MIYLSTGVDLVEISRIELALYRSGFQFIEELLNNNEIIENRLRITNPSFIAGRLAAKEAVAKNLGTGFDGFHWHEIEIQNTKTGQPFVKLLRRAYQVALKRKMTTFNITIAHSQNYAIAYSMAFVGIGD